MRFAKDGIPVIITVLFLSLMLVLIGWLLNNDSSWLLYFAAIVISGFTLFFFRDPERTSPQGDYILAPADGRVISIKTVREETYLEGNAKQVTIFLSLADIHVNRYPMSGVVEHVAYFPGKYLVAWHPKASELNERAEFGILHPSGVRLFYRQITGLVARRIVFYTKKGDEVKAGERFGLMKFGSRMDILVPPDMEIKVKKGDKTVGGETIIADLG
ncbi:MAG: phosphatidylserine decarboxylase family protein [Bacteroidota bacterium]